MAEEVDVGGIEESVLMLGVLLARRRRQMVRILPKARIREYLVADFSLPLLVHCKSNKTECYENTIRI